MHAPDHKRREKAEPRYLDMAHGIHLQTEPAIRSSIEALGLPSRSHGLDAGCGNGDHTLWLAEAVSPGGRVTGIDISQDCISCARARTFVADIQAHMDCARRSALMACFSMLWGRAKPELSAGDWSKFQLLCLPELQSPVFDQNDYYGFITYTLFHGCVVGGQR